MYDMLGTIQVLAQAGNRATDRYVGGTIQILLLSEKLEETASKKLDEHIEMLKKLERIE